MPKKAVNRERLHISIRLDRCSREMLDELLNGNNLSSFLRQQIALAYGRKLEREDNAKHQALATVSSADSE